MTTPHSLPPGAVPEPGLVEQRKAWLVQRIQARREIRRAMALERRLRREADGARTTGAAAEFPRSRLFRLLGQRPWAAAAAVAAGWALGPRRLGRLASWLLPLLIRRGRS